MDVLHRQLGEPTDRISAAVAVHGGPESRDATVYNGNPQQLRQLAVIVRVLMSP